MNPAMLALLASRGAVAATALSGTAVGSAHSTTSGNVQTFTDVPIGEPIAGRTIIVCAGGFTTSMRAITGVSINGVAATIDAKSPNGWFTSCVARFPGALEGDTANIAVTFNNAVGVAAVFVYALPGPVVVAGTMSTQSAAPTLGVVASASDGWTVATSAKGDNYDMAWTGLTEDFELTVSARRFGSASAQTMAGDLTIRQDSVGQSSIAAVTYAAGTV